jgi:hypothetical protein
VGVKGLKRDPPYKKEKCIKVKNRSEKLVFGDDIDMDRVIKFSDRVVVERARGRHFGMDFLKDWAREN